MNWPHSNQFMMSFLPGIDKSVLSNVNLYEINLSGNFIQEIPAEAFRIQGNCDPEVSRKYFPLRADKLNNPGILSKTMKFGTFW